MTIALSTGVFLIKDWLIGNMGSGGDFAYQDIHFHSVAVVFLLWVGVILYAYLCKKPSHRRKLLVAISIFQLSFEILWRVIYLFVSNTSLPDLWPMYPCNLGGILLPIIALADLRMGKQLFYLFGFIGGILTFAIPDGIFTRDVLVFPILKSILQHTGLLLIPALEFVANTYRPTLKDLGWVVLGSFIHIINCEVIDRLLGLTGDYMFFRSGMPFVIPGVPQFITLSLFSLLVFTALSFLCDIPGSVAFLKSFRKKKSSV